VGDSGQLFLFTGGSKADLILELLRHEKLSPDELATLRKIASRKQKDV